MAKKPMQWLSRSLITSPYFIGLCTDAAAFTKALKRLKVAEAERPPFVMNAHSHAATHFFQQTKDMEFSAIVCLCPKGAKGKSVVQVHALLVHEAVHIWQYIRENIGEREPSHEFEAYSVQHIAQELMAAWERAK